MAETAAGQSDLYGAAAAPPLAHGIVGVAIFVATEVMFFGGLITGFLILRAGAMAWPPPGQPRLPLAATGVNTLVLIASGFSMHRALSAIRKDRRSELLRWLLVTALLGAVFLAVQGFEWLRLLRYGLTLTSGLYGATFYTLIGAHGLHVAGAMIALSVVFRRASAGRYSTARHGGVEACFIYWSFVVVLWPVLYALVYLS